MKVAPSWGGTAAGAGYGGSSGSTYERRLVCVGVILDSPEEFDERSMSVSAMRWCCWCGDCGGTRVNLRSRSSDDQR